MGTLTALSPDHFQEIVVDSAIDPDVADARGYRTLDGSPEDRHFLEETGYSRSVWDRDDAYPMLLVPMRGADGGVNGYQVKPRVPRVRISAQGEPKPIKYETPRGAPLVVDMPAQSLEWLRADEGRALWLTEGMKKTDALVSAGCAAFGLTGVFNWRSKMGTLGDWEDAPIKGRPVVLCFDADAAGNRNVQLAMTRLGAWLKTRGAQVVHYVVTPAEIGGTAVKGVDDFFAAGGTVEGLHAVATTTAPGSGATDAAFTDAYLVEEACSGALDGRFCWSSGLGWMKWDGRVWVSVADTEPVEAIRQWALTQFQSALDRQKQNMAEDMRGQVTGWRAVLTKSRLRALVDLARGIVERYAEDFDADPDLLTCRNGVLHLPTGTLRPFDAADSMTLMAGADYRRGYTHPMWTKALTAVPTELHEWLQDRLGQALTGYKTPDHVLVISQGAGSNGKSTITNTVRRAIGKYGVQISDRVLMANPGDHPTEMMDLRGARYAVLEETPEARQLNTQKLKQSLGTEDITARHIRQDSVTFKATHSLFVNTNYKPSVVETDHGTWRRLALLVYPFTFHKRPQDVVSDTDRLGDPKMEYIHDDPDVRAAALAWMAEGARAWYARERRMMELPARVEADTRAWRAEMDLVLGFTDEMLCLKPDAFTSKADLLEAFNVWAGELGHRPWNDKTFGTRFGSHDVVTAAKVSSGKKYVGGKQVRGWHNVQVRKGDDPFNPGDLGPRDPEPTPEPEPPYRLEFWSGEDPSVSKVMHSDTLRITKLDECGKPVGPDVLLKPEPEPETAPGAVGFDLETADVDELFTGRHEGPFVRLVGMTNEETRDVLPNVPTLIADLNKAETIYGHNILGFDLLALAHHHGADFDKLAEKSIDTLVLARLIDPPMSKKMPKGYYGLDKTAQRLGHVGKTDDIKKLAAKHGGFDRIPLDDPEYAEYLRGDLMATDHVYETLLPDVTDYARREMRVAALQNRMTLNGWRVDEELLARRVAEEDAKRMEAMGILHSEFGMPLAPPDKFRLFPKAQWPESLRTLSIEGARNALKLDPEQAVRVGMAVRVPQEPYASPWSTDAGRAALEDAFRAAGAPTWPTTPSGQLALSSDALGDKPWYDAAAKRSKPGMLQVHGDKPQVRRLVETIGLATGARRKYAEVQEYVTGTGRVHSRIGDAQGSGRWAHVKPSFSTMATRGLGKGERAVMVADEGHVLITCDLSQVDLRAMAGLSQDAAYMELFQPGRDAHMEMAKVYFGVQNAETRQSTKAFNHAGNYGQGAKAVSERTGIPLLKCYEIQAAKERSYPVLMEFIKETRERAARGELLDNGFGRKMRPDPARAHTQGPALVGQGASRDIMCESLLRLVDMADADGQNVRPYLRGVVHDEVILSVPEGDVQYWQIVLARAFTWEWRGVPILCEVSNPAKNWADCQH